MKAVRTFIFALVIEDSMCPLRSLGQQPNQRRANPASQACKALEQMQVFSKGNNKSIVPLATLKRAALLRRSFFVRRTP